MEELNKEREEEDVEVTVVAVDFEEGTLTLNNGEKLYIKYLEYLVQTLTKEDEQVILEVLDKYYQSEKKYLAAQKNAIKKDIQHD